MDQFGDGTPAECGAGATGTVSLVGAGVLRYARRSARVNQQAKAVSSSGVDPATTQRTATNATAMQHAR